MKTQALVLSALLASLAFASPSRSEAGGLVIDASTLPTETRAKLRADIETARKEVPALFEQVHAIARRANELDEASRVRGAPFTMQLKALGSRALFPMLEMLAEDAHAPKDLTPTAARALRLGLVEAVGIVRDARAIPVLGVVLERERDEGTVRSAAEALARINTEATLDLVGSALRQADAQHDVERARAVLDGAGAFKRLAAAKLLAARLAARPDDATARVVARSLGAVGNAWAWKSLADTREEAATRDAAARALVVALVQYKGEARGAIEKALLVVDAPATRSLLADARRSATPDQIAVLDAFEQRLARNPTR